MTKFNQKGNVALIALIGVAIVILSAVAYVGTRPEESNNNSTKDSVAMMEEKNDAMMEKDDVSIGSYKDYTQATFDSSKNSKRVLFFHAKWCPTCKAADNDINKNISNIPAGVTLLKVDYDKEKELKKKYGITYQHTFVIVDKDGNEIKKWNGGRFDKIIEQIN